MQKVCSAMGADMTFGTGKLYKRPLLVAYKYSGEISDSDRAKARKLVSRRLISDGMMTSVSTNGFGHGVLIVFDSYMVEQLSIFKRLCHTLRVLKAAISSYIGVSPVVKIIILE